MKFETDEGFDGERRLDNGAPSQVVSIRGDLDAGTVDGVRHLIQQAAGVGTVRADMGGVGFSDSSGLNALVRTHNDLRREGRRLVLVNVPPRLRRLLEMSGLDELLESDHSVQP